MALLTKVSIKWKLSLAIIGSGLILISAYVWIAGQVFKSDKITYVFESQSSNLESVKTVIESQIKNTLVSARAIAASYDVTAKRVPEVGSSIFSESGAMVGLELWDVGRKESLFRLEKQQGLIPPVDNAELESAPGAVLFRPMNDQNAMVIVRYAAEDKTFHLLRAVVDVQTLLPQVNVGLSYALIQGPHVLFISDLRGLDPKAFGEAAAAFPNTAARTLMWPYKSEKFLLSQTPLNVGNLGLVGLTPEAEALGALGTLFKRSVVFVLFSSFGLILISLLLARGLTVNLATLTQAAQEIGSGNFDVNPDIQSEDEIGVLAGAFKTMTLEIKKLLIHMTEKTRMEGELKTAKLIQERLLPSREIFSYKQFEVCGTVLSSSECGGDWWHCFAKGDNLFVAIADATGHGTPAALITAAARSIFSRLEQEDLSLAEMMVAWDHAVSTCSHKEVFMTGMLLQINMPSGSVAIMNAAHESPYLIQHATAGKFAVRQTALKLSKRVGDDYSPIDTISIFELREGEGLVLYTDGLFSVLDEAGKSLSEMRFGRALANRVDRGMSAKDIVDKTLQLFDEHRKNAPYPDDVSVVAIRRVGAA